LVGQVNFDRIGGAFSVICGLGALDRGHFEPSFVQLAENVLAEIASRLNVVNEWLSSKREATYTQQGDVTEGWR